MFVTDNDLYSQITIRCNNAYNCTIPLIEELAGNRYKTIGSAVYLASDKHFYLVTAEHVISGLKTNHILIPHTESYLEKICVKDNFKLINNDGIDIAFCELSNPLSSFIPLSLNDCIDIEKAPDNQICVACGYPSTLCNNYKNISEVKLTDLMTLEIQNEKYKHFHTNRNKNIIIMFDRNYMIKNGIDKTVFPEPFGMSGGGLFWIHTAAKYDDKITPKLIGILNEWKSKDKVILSTNINQIIEYLK